MLDNVELQMNDYLPLRDVVFETLRQAILKGTLLPGERLMEIHLAQRLGVSRTPVREAIRKLELEGLVKMIPRKGAVVAEITASDLEDVLEVRHTLEKFAVAKACRNVTEEFLGELHQAESMFQDAVAREDLVGCAQADEKLHEIIFRMTGNRRLMQILSNLREQMYRFRIEYLKDRESHELLIQEHNQIISAIEEGNESLAVQLTGEHVKRQRDRILQILTQRELDKGTVREGKEPEDDHFGNDGAQAGTGVYE